MTDRHNPDPLTFARPCGALAIDRTARPSAYEATATYLAFRITEDGKTVPLGEMDAGTLSHAVEAAKTRCFHKERLAIRETGFRLRTWANGAEEVPLDRLHIYAIKQRATASYEYVDHVMRRVQTLYADPVCTMDAGMVFAARNVNQED